MRLALGLLLLSGCIHLHFDPLPIVLEYKLKPVDMAGVPEHQCLMIYDGGIMIYDGGPNGKTDGG